MKKYLVIYDEKTGFCNLANVGFFDAETPEQAKASAKEQWNTTADLYAINADGLPDGWSYYT